MPITQHKRKGTSNEREEYTSSFFSAFQNVLLLCFFYQYVSILKHKSSFGICVAVGLR